MAKEIRNSCFFFFFWGGGGGVLYKEGTGERQRAFPLVLRNKILVVFPSDGSSRSICWKNDSSYSGISSN